MFRTSKISEAQNQKFRNNKKKNSVAQNIQKFKFSVS